MDWGILAVTTGLSNRDVKASSRQDLQSGRLVTERALEHEQQQPHVVAAGLVEVNPGREHVDLGRVAAMDGLGERLQSFDLVLQKKALVHGSAGALPL